MFSRLRLIKKNPNGYLSQNKVLKNTKPLTAFKSVTSVRSICSSSKLLSMAPLSRDVNYSSGLITNMQTLALKKKKPIKLIVGDRSGSTVDMYSTAPVIAFRKLLLEWGFLVPDNIIRKYMGLSKREHIVALLKEPTVLKDWISMYDIEPTDSDIDILYHRFTDIQLEVLSKYENVMPLPRIIETFREAKKQGVMISITTGFNEVMDAQLVSTLKKHNSELLDLIDISVPVRKGIRGRPHGDGIKFIMEKFGITDPHQVFKFGDTRLDILEGDSCNTITGGMYKYTNTVGIYTGDIDKVERTDPKRYQDIMNKSIEEFGPTDYIFPTSEYILEILDRHKKM